ncbi:SCO3242 family prenyltransferase [Actinoplanes friuliensis]|uniref:UbiA prenyltransferase n=1 Tax=Actinoplanes friuliensis DSM 7358 TaxID=1246995 RepID=U5W0N5_9ACTN|nr:UbiA family prenyltransferase [Actinoplanes friuliensis]AGZ42803.1 UbiA prenyltransferase [Actinoplanes friuliensis DSM 7358]
MKSPLRTLAELVRAPAALSVPGDVIAGAAAAGSLAPATAGLAGASVCLYWAGMAANDWADRDLDATERPERPIPSGRISAPAALGIAAGLTAAGLALAARSGGARALAVAGPLAAAVWAYDLRLKNTAAGPAGMAVCRALDVLLGASTGNPVRALPAALVVAAHTYTVTELSRREVAGSTTAALPAATLAATAGLAGAVAARSGTVTAVLAGEYATSYGRAQAKLFGDPSAPRVRAAVGAGITALPALQGALTARAGRTWAGVAVAAAAPLGRLLARKVSPT